jgi:uncharacterized protein YcnI
MRRWSLPYRSTFRPAGVGAAAAAVLALSAATADAHVTAQPPELSADEFVKVAFRAPNERDVPTVKIAVQLPPELDAVRVQPVAGWSYKVTRRKLPRPRELFGEKVTEYVARIEWSRGRIDVPELQEFPVSMKLPKRGNFGRYMVFPATQTYANGEVVRWIQIPETPAGNWDALEEPAAHALLTSSQEPKLATEEKLDDEVGGARNWGIAGLGVGSVALALALAVTLRRRRGA